MGRQPLSFHSHDEEVELNSRGYPPNSICFNALGVGDLLGSPGMSTRLIWRGPPLSVCGAYTPMYVYDCVCYKYNTYSLQKEKKKENQDQQKENTPRSHCQEIIWDIFLQLFVFMSMTALQKWDWRLLAPVLSLPNCIWSSSWCLSLSIPICCNFPRGSG